MFPTTIEAIKDRSRQINPTRYAAIRNYADRTVTKLIPSLSRGVISTKQLFHYIQSLDIICSHLEKLIQELAWRNYWQQVWIAEGDVIDRAIRSLYQIAYMQNHMRMYVVQYRTGTMEPAGTMDVRISISSERCSRSKSKNTIAV